MLTIAKAEQICLSVDNQFQIDYLLDYIERREAQICDDQLIAAARQSFSAHIKPSSILSAEELTMLSQLFYREPKM
ncbi:hypothetical protein L2719_02905 [Shewanella schlegeliana]|uniref:Uncharacterized protein n=1 Tax=Shewanella schlegeliana TaxID=190308 RepID=A0ABS1T282_9GAMM|nr:hypothetical protein [Shewanella schlegeliana]MBL4913626.1 hypothetical protein [Shewanella schlegeliana]MCL1108517.1 hypothetical protein [Shewanella schlegeliana]GIU30856.1 hypothetical protein TUM4433_21840 [Shewanella schlegeliana]